MSTFTAKALAAFWLLGGAAAALAKPPMTPLQRGRYLIQTAGCNDCHTPGYGPNNGQVSEKLWLTGWAGAAPGAPPTPPTCVCCWPA